MSTHQEIPPPAAKPQTFEEAFKTLTMTEQEAELLEEDTFAEVGELSREERAVKDTDVPKANIAKDPNALPEWVTFPQGFRIPPGKEVAFLQFRAKWTDRPERGDRWCMLWPLSDADEKLAIKRTRGEGGRALSELSKGCIRVIDGKRADWTQAGDKDTTYAVDRFWDEIGGKCRQMITNIYLKTHSLTKEEQADFLENCCFIRKAVVG